MLSGNLFQFDEYSTPNYSQSFQQDTTGGNADNGAFGDLRDYLTSDNTFNDLLSEFDLNSNDLHSFDPLAATHVGQLNPPTSNELPPAYETVLLPTNVQQTFNPFLSLNDVKQTHLVHYGNPSTNFSETSSLLSVEIPQQQTSTTKSATSKKLSNGKRTRPAAPIHLPKLIKKPEPIPVTLDQFQALICSAPDPNPTNVGKFSTLLENSTIIGNNIPLKIVNQTNNLSSDENSRHDSPLSSHSFTTNITSVNSSNGTGRVRRKSSHNAIEKRYRSSINERILELKEIVADNDEKVQKSGVLRRTVEYIRQLQSTNRRLEEENNTLKTILKRLNLSNVELPTSEDSPSSDRSSSMNNITTPPSSHDDSSDEAFSPVPKRQKRTTSKQGMVNGSRLVLCCFMLCVLITNPFSYLLNLIHSSDFNDQHDLRTIVNSRTLQSTKINDDFLSTSWRQLVAWMLNLAICLVCLVKLFVYGEPILSECEMKSYSIEKTKADQLMSENLPNEAKVYYRQCCEKLCVTIDQTFLYYLSSITWQMTRFCVNLIFVGRWLTFWSGWTKSIDTRDYNRELNDCLLQLWKIEYDSRSSSTLALFNFFISTLNTLVNGGKKIDQIKRNEIYFLSALTLNRFGGIFTFFVRYFLRSIRINDLNDLWLTDVDRLTEFIEKKQNETKIFFEPNQFFESIRKEFVEFNLLENIRNQLENHPIETTTNAMKMPVDLDEFHWWQHVLQVLRCISDETSSLETIISTDTLRQMDENTPTIYQIARSIDLIDERYITTIETIHSILLVLHDDTEQNQTTSLSLLEQLGQSSRMIIVMAEENSDRETQLDLAIRTLIFDGILALRLRLLTNTLNNDDGKLPYLDDFQHELDHYRPCHRRMKLAKERLNLFESIYRVSSGLNPLTIQMSFESAVKTTSINVDLLTALLLFCHFAPSTVFHYRTIFQRAASIGNSTRKNNDLSRLRHQCLTLIRQPYLTL